MRRGPALRMSAVCAAAIGFAAAAGAGAATLTVTNTNDGGAGSLRDLILEANGSPGADLIQFAIPGAGVHTIFASSALPEITESVLIDGYSQPGSAWNSDPVGQNAVLQIELLGNGTDGLTITGGGTIVQGLAISGFQTAITISGQENNLILGNFIGTDAAGGATGGNARGILITSPFGLDRVGDGYAAARNLISGNGVGIAVQATGGKSIFNNLIGTGPTGLTALPNGTGVELTACTFTSVGGTPAERNVISGNSGHAVSMTDGAFNAVFRNYIGTDAAGTRGLGNGGDGVRIAGTEQNFLVYRNVISGNVGDGVSLADTDVPDGNPDAIDTNWIGTAADGFSPVGNGGAGVRVSSFDDLRLSNNTVAFNRVGVWIPAPSIYNACEIVNASMFGNRGGLGIVNAGIETIATNLPGGAFNFPIITSVTPEGGGTRVAGYLSGHANDPVTIELYRTPGCSAVRPRDFIEGRTSFGTIQGTTDAAGDFAFDAVWPVVLNGEVVTATSTITQTSPLRGFFGPTKHTSSFSQRLPFSMSPSSGPAAGGAAVTISGTNFQAGATVTIGGQPAGDVVVASYQQITATTPALAAGAAYDLAVTNPGGPPSALRLAWVADFLDVPPSSPFYDFVAKLAGNGVTGGVGGGNYGVAQSVLRQQMAVFLLKSKHGICYAPPPCTGVFADVPCPSGFADWIEALAAEGITGGCGAGAYCPQDPVRRDQMAVFLLKAEHGSSYTPPGCGGVFADVPCPGPFTDWIEQLAAENITGGCGGSNYCPANPNTRGQMAVFLVKTFGLQ